MTSTPCTDSPLWTSDDAADRRKAAPLCAGCPIFTECGADAMRRRPSHGVYAGVDFSRESVTAATPSGTARSCQNCGQELVKARKDSLAQFATRKFCSLKCSNSRRAGGGRADRVAEVEFLIEQGDGADQITKRLGLSQAALNRSMYRAGRPDLAALFVSGTVRDRRIRCGCGGLMSMNASRCMACRRATLRGDTTLSRAS